MKKWLFMTLAGLMVGLGGYFAATQSAYCVTCSGTCVVDNNCSAKCYCSKLPDKNEGICTP